MATFVNAVTGNVTGVAGIGSVVHSGSLYGMARVGDPTDYVLNKIPHLAGRAFLHGGFPIVSYTCRWPIAVGGRTVTSLVPEDDWLLPGGTVSVEAANHVVVHNPI